MTLEQRQEAHRDALQMESASILSNYTTCLWCGAGSKSEDFCTECNAPNTSGESYCQCPYCGEIHSDTNVTCCGERHVEKIELKQD